MSDLEIPQRVVEAAAKAIRTHRFPAGEVSGIGGVHAQELAEAAVRAAKGRSGRDEG